MSREKFDQLANTLAGCTAGKMFGKECIKAANGKALAIFFQDAMVFKLRDDAYEKAMALDGASIFEPSKGRPMKGWVQFAKTANEYVSTLPANNNK